jgi:endonuclease/exonuclease/phosphatase (EEP) superfamily protein YafD
MASKYPVEYKHFELAGYEALEAILNVNGSPLRIIGVHPFPPSRSDLAQIRDQQYLELIAKINSDKIPTAVVGDFNSSPWSPKFKELLAETNLKDAALGFGIVNTWNVNIPFLKIPIDHVLVSPEVGVSYFGRTSELGSDHYPIVASLRLP